MKKKELLKQLNSLKDTIKPDADWQASNREILLSQINAQTRLDFAEKKFKLLPNLFQRKFAMSVLKPMASLVIILVFVFGAWTASVSATKKSLPGDLFYNIKLTTERVQVNLTLNDEKRTNLEIAFAQRRLDEIEKIIEQNEPDNLAVPLQKFRENMNNVKSNLAKLEIKDKESAVKVANMIDEKTAEYVDVLIDQQEKSPEVALNTEEAITASKSTGDKALSLIIEEYEQGDSDLPEEDIVGKVQNRLDDLEKSLNSVKTDIDLIIQAQVAEAERLAQEAEQAAQAEAEAAESEAVEEETGQTSQAPADQEPAGETETAAETEQSSAESSETEAPAEPTELADNETAEEPTEPVDNNNEETADNEESAEPTVTEQITNETPQEPAEDLPAIEETTDLRIKALTLLADAKDLLDDKKISQAFTKIKQADDLANLINKVITANNQYLEQAKAEQEIESNEESGSEPTEENPADKNSAAQLLSE
ncbi:MAG: hypothetical protein GF365_00245 [Candidatus Buchananbacteria bacterium]|nr:hypothetical protein [Candidatus Buchananbacteria bacterium]